MKRLTVVWIAALVAVCMLGGCQGHTPRTTQEQSPSIQSLLTARDPDVLIVAHVPDFPPYESVDTKGESIGVSIDVMREIARRLNRPVKFRALPWTEVLAQLSSGEVDLTPSMVYTPQRGREWALSLGWGTMTSVVYVRRTSKIRTIRDVVPKIVASPTGYMEYEQLQVKGVQHLVGTENVEEALRRTVTGAADSAGCNREVAKTIFKQHIGWESALFEIETPLAVTPVTIAGRKESESLIHRISEIIGEMKRDGTLAQLTASVGGQPSS
ncbi:MAG TPA: transporter substrate-binding domain-containing protein [bacterium]|nr:transporter substrate-binding domain-containing protein [bacterium]HQP97846.1 transporter substrate-binding domain-containing protein [bacterium]